MVAFPAIARIIGHHCRRASNSYSQWFPNANLKPNSVSGAFNFSSQWQLHITRNLILESVSEAVKLHRLSGSDTGIIELNLDMPAAKNAIGKDMLRGLQTSFDTIEKDLSARVLLIRSSVPKERRGMSDSEVHSYVKSLRLTFSHLEELHLPTIAVIEGAALGGGLEMALSCDIRISGPYVYVVLQGKMLSWDNQKLDLLLSLGGTQRLPRLVGRSVEKELIFTGRRVSGKDALLLGLVNYCVPTGGAHQKVLEIAREITQKGPVAVRMAKRAINEGMETVITSAWSVEEECYRQTIYTKDRLEGLAAFAEKRKLRYTGILQDDLFWMLHELSSCDGFGLLNPTTQGPDIA